MKLANGYLIGEKFPIESEWIKAKQSISNNIGLIEYNFGMSRKPVRNKVNDNDDAKSFVNDANKN